MNRLTTRASVVALIFIVAGVSASAQSRPTIAQFLSPGFPVELVSVRKADRIARMQDFLKRNLWNKNVTAALK